MVNFGPIDSVPEKYAHRNLYKHNPTVTLMRTTVEENIEIANRLSEKWNQAKSKMALMLPLKGVSMIDGEGQPFNGPEEDQALFDTLKTNLTNENVEIVERDMNINDPEFALEAAKRLVELMEGK